KVLHEGKLMQFVPDDNVYVYFRYNDHQPIMIAMNCSEEAKTLNTKRFAERLDGYTKALNVATDVQVTDLSSLQLGRKSTLILELKK
ncbi:MAG: cyclomaltodextrinase C-terminal domain-containing protein, partial [Cyclobacteriaceae bacterium]